MPLDVRGCTRATLTGSACAYPTPAGAGNPLNPIRDGDRGLQLFPMNEEFPVSAGHKLALIKSLPFVHTARRYYRLDGLVRPSDRPRRGRRSEEHTSELQSHSDLVCRLLLEKKKNYMHGARVIDGGHTVVPRTVQ